MPLEAVAIHAFDAPIMRKPKHNNDLRERIAKLYTSVDTTTAEGLTHSSAIMAQFETAFRQGDLMYVGMFNDKPIMAVGCFDDGQTDTKRLQYLAVHPENANRGIDAKFIKLVYDQEVIKGVRQFMPVDKRIHQIMQEYELLEVKG